MLGWRENKLLKAQNGLNYGKFMELCEVGPGDTHYNLKILLKRIQEE